MDDGRSSLNRVAVSRARRLARCAVSYDLLGVMRASRNEVSRACRLVFCGR